MEFLMIVALFVLALGFLAALLPFIVLRRSKRPSRRSSMEHQ